ncbi:MAG: anhydro-N-acetylmuramic acid kinase [Gemmatimonadales bacterium]
MSERPTLAVGLMSGTSLDGIDAALVRIEGPNHVHLVHFLTRPYTQAEQRQILDAIETGGTRALAHLHVRLATWSADAVDALLEESHTRATELGFIAFHGQTIWHEPPEVSWQLGEPAVLAERFGVRIASNFRSRDVAAGGQGAPLVPAADVLLFGHLEHPRVLLNIGGMANLTFVPRRDLEAGAFAFDTGPGMAVIDSVARLVTPGSRYDVDGRMAQSGVVDQAVVERLLADPWFAVPPPKSTGRERFGDDYARALHREVPGVNGVATAVELTARSIVGAIDRVPNSTEVVISGGGVHHPVLTHRLAALLGERNIPVFRFDQLFFSSDAKEAVAFALLGYLTIHGQPGNVPSATGAAGHRVLGQVTPA